MIRTVPLSPPPGDWIAIQIDELHDDGSWTAVAARPLEGRAPTSLAAAFTDQAIAFRAVSSPAASPMRTSTSLTSLLPIARRDSPPRRQR